MKNARLYLLAFAGLFAFSSCNSSSGNKKEKSNVPSNQLPPAYELRWDNYEEKYIGYNFKEKMGRQLLTEVHNYCIDKHQTYITYGNYWFYVNTAADRIPGTDTNQIFYTGKTCPRELHTNQDREHVWACANSNGLWYRDSQYIETNIDTQKGKGEKYWGGGSDLYHVRPATSRINSARSNAPFYDFDENEPNLTILQDGGPYKVIIGDGGKKVEVDDAFKGDVARILMYVYAHYSKLGDKNVYYSKDYTPVYDIADAVPIGEGEDGKKHDPNVCGNLSLTSIVGYKDINECYEKLITWNRIDPPSEVEMNRNNYVETIQGNRNPFVDYPQLVDMCLI